MRFKVIFVKGTESGAKRTLIKEWKGSAAVVIATIRRDH
jgi:hypothetical protein